nr:ABC transporter permease [Bacteroidales bacterium]
MNNLGIIIAREYGTRVRKKSFLILTFLTPLLMVALIMLPMMLATIKSGDSKDIAVYDESGQYVGRLQSTQQFVFIPYEKPISQISAEEKDDYSAFLSISGNLCDSSGQVSFYSLKQISMDLKYEVESQLEAMASEDKIASYNIPELAQILQEVKPSVRAESVLWSEKDSQSEQKTSSEISMIIGMVATLLIYMFIFIYGSMVMNGVVEEKSNRIVEIIVSSVKPFQLMMGKIVGIALVGLTQVALWVILVSVLSGVLGASIGLSDPTAILESQTAMMATSPAANMDSEMMAGLQLLQSFNWGQIILWFVLFFLGGYLLYASIFAAIGGAIDNNDDAQQFTLPVTIPVIFALYIGIYGAMNPDGPMVLWCSFIPFFSPIVMMVRLPFGVPGWQLALSFGLLVLTFLLIVKIAAKIYRTGILMYGKKVTYKDLWKWLKYKS